MSKLAQLWTHTLTQARAQAEGQIHPSIQTLISVGTYTPILWNISDLVREEARRQ